MNTKQVIVIRRYYPDTEGKQKKVRLGKLFAQAAHASVKVVLELGNFKNNPFVKNWLEGSFTKICVYVDFEEELLEVYNKAKKEGMPCSLITDAGKTEFNGVATKTCCAIGPWDSDKIDKITGGLKLL